MSFKSKLLFPSVLLGLLALMLSGIVRADSIVTVGSTTYDITTLTGTFSGNSATLEGTPWFGNMALAQSIAAAVGTAFGTPQSLNDPGLESGENFGPLFAYQDISGWVTSAVFGVPYFSTPGFVSGRDWYDFLSAIWATGSVVPPVGTPEPGTLSLMIAAMLGLGLLVGMKRYRRNDLSTEA